MYHWTADVFLAVFICPPCSFHVLGSNKLVAKHWSLSSPRYEVAGEVVGGDFQTEEASEPNLALVVQAGS